MKTIAGRRYCCCCFLQGNKLSLQWCQDGAINHEASTVLTWSAVRGTALPSWLHTAANIAAALSSMDITGVTEGKCRASTSTFSPSCSPAPGPAAAA